MNDRQLRTSLIKLAHRHPEHRTRILTALKKAHGPVVLKRPEVMLYMIDKSRNNSKFYEMSVMPTNKAPRASKQKGDGEYVVVKRWGRLTDSGATGRVDSMNEHFWDEREARSHMEKHKRAKMSKGYEDVTRAQEYPIGLGGAGFGWGGQAVCSVQPDLKNLLSQMYRAQEDLNKGMKMIAPIAKTDSTMAKKLKGQLEHALRDVADITSYLSDQLRACG